MREIKKKISIKIFKPSYINKTNYLKWLGDKIVTKYLYRDDLDKTIKKKEILKYVTNLFRSKNDFFYLIYVNSNAIGTVKIGHIDWKAKTADIGIMIGEKNYWNKGYATKVIKLIIMVSEKKLNLRKLVAGTPGLNHGMIKAFKKNGFKIEGKRIKQLYIAKKYVDHILFGKFLKK